MSYSRRDLYALGEPIGDSATRVEGCRRVYGGGGGGSSSSSSTSTTTKNTDKRQVVDNSSIGVSSDSSTVNVNYTDQGAVNKAIDLVANAGQGALDAYKSLLAATVALGAKNDGMAAASAALTSDLMTTQSGASGVTDSQKKALTYGGLAVVAYFVLKKA